MKKIFFLTTVFFYLFATSGMAITVHYCAGKISSIDFFDIHKKKCDCTKKVIIKKNCCKNKSEVIKIKDNHFSSSETSVSAKDVSKYITALTDFTSENSFVQFQNELFLYHYTSIQQSKRIPLYLRNCVFII